MAGTPKKRLRKILASIDEDGLIPEDRRFCDLYVRDHDLHKAIRMAYGSSRNAQKLITRPEIIAALKRREDYISTRFKCTTEWMVDQLSYIAGARHRDFYDEEGKPIPTHLLPDYADAALAGIDIEERFEKDSDGNRVPYRILKYRFHNKNEAIVVLMRHKGVDHAPSAEGRDRLKELVEVFKAGPVKLTIEGEIEDPKKK